jgi:hypothetical protein
MDKLGVGSCPFEAHSGGWEGLVKDGQEPTPLLAKGRHLFPHLLHRKEL